jgi:hypothetical protein
MERSRFCRGSFTGLVNGRRPPTRYSLDRAKAGANQLFRPLQRVWSATDRHASRPASDTGVMWHRVNYANPEQAGRGIAWNPPPRSSAYGLGRFHVH